MTTAFRHRLLIALLAPLLLAGCLLSPGKFTSALTVEADRRFSFTYQGEVYAIDPSGEMKASAAVPGPDASAEDRAAAATQRAETAAAERELDDKRKAIAVELAKEAGYRSVKYLGGGKYLIDYAISGRLDHGFFFPFNSDAEIAVPFIALELRKDGAVRLKAPAFGKSGDKSATGPISLPGTDKSNLAEGTFTLIARAPIVMHNNEEGTRPAPGGGEQIVWTVGAIKRDSPVAVLRPTG